MSPKARWAPTRGASQSAASSWQEQSHGVWVPSQPGVSGRRSVNAKVNVVSFNFGIDQNMLKGKNWLYHERKLRGLLQKFRLLHHGAFIFGCELGGHREGMADADVDFQNIVSNALTDAQSATHGAYAVVYPSSAQLIDTDTFVPPGNCNSEMRWTIFEMSIRGDSQLAEVPVCLIVGNFHIRTPSARRAPTKDQRRSWTQSCLNHLAGLGQMYGDQTAVVRILCGDVNMNHLEASAATQGCRRPCSGLVSQPGRLLCWDCLATEEKLSGDLLFVSGAFAEPYTIPVGTSYPDKGMRNDSHDAVAIRVHFPQSSVPHMASRPAAFSAADDSASQPAESASAAAASSSADGSASQPAESVSPPAASSAADGGASQPAESASPAATRSVSPAPSQSDDFEPDYDGDDAQEASGDELGTDFPQEDVSPDADPQVQQLHTAMCQAEENDELGPEIQHQLGRLLFKKRVIVVDGRRRSYVASIGEVRSTIKTLIQRRRRFLRQKNLPENHILNDEQRRELMQQWKDEFNALPDQKELQMRDSKKAFRGAAQPAAERKGKGTGKFKGKRMPQRQGKPQPEGFGPNKDKQHAGKHSRFARHMQLVGGTKQICEMILYTGTWNVQMLRNLQSRRQDPALSTRPENPSLKQQKIVATFRLRYAQLLVSRGNMDDLTDEDQALVEQFHNGTLLQAANEAVMAYGHGTLRDPRSTATMPIGGSTGGNTRELLDRWSQPDATTLRHVFGSR